MSSTAIDRENNISRTLTRLLRHGSPNCNISCFIGEDGYITREDLLKIPYFAAYDNEYGFDIDLCRRIVARDKKQRLSLFEGHGTFKIRASQGHTLSKINTDLLLTRITDAEDLPVVIHGTSREAYESILTSGMLHPMERNHVHFTRALPQDGSVISGMRRCSQYAIYINVHHAMELGITFYRSDNDVILTPCPVPVSCFEKVCRIF